ncbi:Permease of the drug/metabolite transporter (DMT) superfamily [Quadrisphaera granulorum]|uniref:Drug/metabolite transporter (DMT)-like permease n=1 Tax=Quadrisphaera granulorum TaxID=317664 RepID=A0A315ZPB2_9ACTN|nr:DMT family transporter [Quadrisphaera granulorum]PWJ47119.1 drug/metabolite transporter (DMT)-like permease [Quadrisphaera granulorum]SZE98923.1 Permease of the drug/metabolite transporter (DMT) superfamily [Quadrisphaera granulorum]
MSAASPSTPRTDTPIRPRAAVLAAYLAIALMWGSSFLLIKVALGSASHSGFSVGGVAIGRIVLGAAALVVVMVLSRTRWPRELWLWGHLTVVGLLLCLVPFLLYAWAGQYLPSGMSAILNATTPIWTALAVTASTRGTAHGERLTRGQVAGVALGVVGVAVVMGLWRLVDDASFAASLPAQLACLGATACYGAGFAWMRRFVSGRHGHGSLTVAAGQVGSAAVIGLVLSPLLVPHLVVGGSAPGLTPTLALVALGVLGTGLAYVWNNVVLVEWGSLAASSVTYLTPLVGVVAGVLVLGERITWNEPVGALVVVVSVLLVQKRLPRRPSQP